MARERGYADLREFLEALEEHDKLVRVTREINKDTEMHPLVRWQFRGLREEERKAFLFENVVDTKGRRFKSPALVGGLAASTDIYCLGVQRSAEEVADLWTKAIDEPIPPEIVDSGPVHEEVHEGDALLEHDGLYEFPIPNSTPGFDNAPYITGGHWITKDPETGSRNMGHYRGMIKGPAKTGLFVGTPQDMVAHWEKCRKLKRPLECAVVVGCAPAVAYAAPQKVPPDVDELALAGGLVGYPIPLVKCRTVELEVPATAEIVLEGVIPTDFLEEEGPFGESTGYVDPRTLSPVFEVRCITHRRNPIWVSVISQVTPSESSKLKAMGMPTFIHRFLVRNGFPSVLEVALLEPLVNLRPHVVLRMKKTSDAEPMEAMHKLLEFGDRVGKYVVAVDEDIDPHDLVAIQWAITHRSQPHKDVEIVGDRPFGATPIGMVLNHPSSRYDRMESSILIDATRKADFPPLSLPKKPFMERAREIWEELDLPKLQPRMPWYGYSLGMWSDEWDQEGDLATESRYQETGDKLAATRVDLDGDTSLKEARRKWAETRQGRAE
jgi:UbiD family decarboxylase